jgi:hypothetical protein
MADDTVGKHLDNSTNAESQNPSDEIISVKDGEDTKAIKSRN